MYFLQDQKQKRQGKVVKFNTKQLSNPTPVWAKAIFRGALYITAIWTVVSPLVTELPAHTIDVVTKYALIATTIINVTIQFFGWDFKNNS